jgi:hypothetical protein
VFLGGSAIHGELCGIEDPSGARFFLSDLDLGILTRARVPAEARSRIAREIEAASGGGPMARVGFYCERDLARQDPTPGFVETLRCGFVLDGPAEELRRFSVPPVQGIPPGEAHRLLSNRIVEWIDASRDDRPAHLAVYAAAKLHADAAAVLLLARRLYRGGGYAARCEAACAQPDLGDDDRVRLRAWTAWRLAPSWRETPLGMDVRAAAAEAVLKADLGGQIERVLHWVLDESGERILQRSYRPRGRAWARSWKRWLRASPRCLSLLHPSGYSRSPRSLLWEAAMDWTMGRESAAAAILERLTGARRGESEAIRDRIAAAGRIMDREGID